LDHKQNEFEIRFGTNTTSGRPLSKIDYDNVVKQLLKSGFKTDLPEGHHYLRINYQNSLTDSRKMADVRAEIVGLDLIQDYCQTNSIQTLLDRPWNWSQKVQFTKKNLARNEKDEALKPIDLYDMGFRVSYQLEQTFHSGVPFVKQVIQTWGDRKKTFRMMNRVRFSHPDLPIFADVSIIRSSKKYAGKPRMDGTGYRYPSNVQIPTYTLQESGVLEAAETYEIELELDNSRLGTGNPLYETAEQIMDALRKTIRIVLCGIQQCFYPISFTERDGVMNQYMKIIRGEKDYEYKKINFTERDFSKQFVEKHGSYYRYIGFVIVGWIRTTDVWFVFTVQSNWYYIRIIFPPSTDFVIRVLMKGQWNSRVHVVFIPVFDFIFIPALVKNQ
jgi:hypothetical protein